MQPTGTRSNIRASKICNKGISHKTDNIIGIFEQHIIGRTNNALANPSHDRNTRPCSQCVKVHRLSVTSGGEIRHTAR